MIDDGGVIKPYMAYFAEHRANEGGKNKHRESILDRWESRFPDLHPGNGSLAETFRANVDPGLRASGFGFSDAGLEAPVKVGQGNGLNPATGATPSPMPKDAAIAPLRGPNLAQLAVGGLTALLVPRLAAAAIAAPFRDGFRRQAEATERNRLQTEGEWARWQAQAQGTRVPPIASVSVASKGDPTSSRDGAGLREKPSLPAKSEEQALGLASADARAYALSGLGGIQGQGRGTDESYARLDGNLSTAIQATGADLDALDAQERRLATIPGSEAARSRLASRRQELTSDLERLHEGRAFVASRRLRAPGA